MFLITDLRHACSQGFINGHPQIGIGANSPIPKQGLGASTSLNSFKEVNILFLCFFSEFFTVHFHVSTRMFEMQFLCPNAKRLCSYLKVTSCLLLFRTC